MFHNPKGAGTLKVYQLPALKHTVTLVYDTQYLNIASSCGFMCPWILFFLFQVFQSTNYLVPEIVLYLNLQVVDFLYF